MEYVILVNKDNEEIGQGEKIRVHQEGRLHRAFSIFVFNFKGELLLQKRANRKYHSGGLWTNTVCSHPRVGENTEEAAHRRLKEELGFDCPLKEIFSFVYNIKFSNGFTENEYDYVFTGRFDGKIVPNLEEIGGWKWISLEELKKSLKENPERYSYWFKIALDKLLNIEF